MAKYTKKNSLNIKSKMGLTGNSVLRDNWVNISQL